jgi:hypothetical protein
MPCDVPSLSTWAYSWNAASTRALKYTVHCTNERELYDLQRDPHEANNLLGPQVGGGGPHVHEQQDVTVVEAKDLEVEDEETGLTSVPGLHRLAQRCVQCLR